MKRLSGKLTYANVISTLCLVLLVGGGTAYAASEMLPKGSVGTKQIQKEAVTPAKLSKASKAALTGAPGQKGATGATGAAGSQGPKGDRGETGLLGSPSDLFRRATYTAAPYKPGQEAALGTISFTPADSGEAIVFARGFCEVEPTEPNNAEVTVGIGHTPEEALDQPQTDQGRIRVPIGKLGPQYDGYTAERVLTVTAGKTETIGVAALGNTSGICTGSVTVLAIF